MPTDRPPIGTKIKRARERLRLTQAQLAARVGVSQKTVDNWEHNRSYPKSAIGALEEILGPLTDGDPPPAPDVHSFPDWVPHDPFCRHIYAFGLPEAAGDETLAREKRFAIGAVVTAREASSGTGYGIERRRA